MRGEDVESLQFRLKAHGITPACAGKTQNFISILCTARDHPRMRGEDMLDAWGIFKFGGSPPHARGRQRGHKTRF